MNPSKNKLAWVNSTYKVLTSFAEKNVRDSINAACEESLIISNCFRFLYEDRLIASIDYPKEQVLATDPVDLSDHPEMKKRMEDINYKKSLLFTGKHIISNYFRMLAFDSNTVEEFLHQLPPPLAQAVVREGALKSDGVFTQETYVRSEYHDDELENRILDLFTAKLMW